MKKRVFVLMPFGSNNEYQGGNDESNFIYDEIIKPGVLSALSDDCSIEREVDKNQPGSITTAIVRSLVRADVVIVDITGWNPNVFLELGMRYALRNKVTIVTAQKGTKIPFDMKGYRHVIYNRFRPKEGSKKIGDFIKVGMSTKVTSDSIVFDTFKDLSVIIPNIVESYGEELHSDRILMSWEEYLGRIEWVCKWLRPPVNEGRYVPDVVFGISNGGMIVADLIGKSVFSGKHTPILGLWAQRWTRKKDYFQNQYNDCLTKTIASIVGDERPVNILLTDDHFGSGNTSGQAFDYLKQQFGEDTKNVFVPLVSRRIEYVEVIEDFLPYNFTENGEHIFPVTKEEFIRGLNTKANYFPYLGKQVSEGLEHINE